MIICHEHRFILLRPGKVGGTSVEAALKAVCDVEEHADVHAPPDVARQQWPKAWAEYLKISLVRNPWDYMVSMVHWVRTHRYRGRFNALFDCNKCGGQFTIERAKGNPLKTCPVCLKRSMFRAPVPDSIGAWMHENADAQIVKFLGSWDEVWDEVTRFTDPAIVSPPAPAYWNFEQYFFGADGAHIPDVTLRFETLADDFAALCERLGVENRLDRLNVHRYRDAPYSDYYTSRDSVDAVRVHFARVIDRYGYAFGI